MSTVTSSLIPETHPSLTTPKPDWSAIHFNDDGTPYLTDRFLLHLSSTMQRYVLALAKYGWLKRAERVANCCRHAAVTRRCRHGKFAGAHKHHCGDYFCINDSSGRWRFNKWASRRDHAAFRIPHQGIELKLSHTADSPIAAAQKLHDAALTLLTRLFAANAFAVDAFAERTSDVAIRIVYPGAHTYSEIHRLQTDLGVHMKVKHAGTEELGQWAFAGFYECAAMSADAKALLRIALMESHHQNVFTLGSLYTTLKDGAESQPHDSKLCPVCKDHDLDVIPFEERHVQTVEEIEMEYEHVDWSSEHLSPFRVSKVSPTNVSPDVSRIPPPNPSVSPSPPI